MASSTSDEARQALHAANRALLHATKWVRRSPAPQEVIDLIDQALYDVAAALDDGRDESREMVAT